MIDVVDCRKDVTLDDCITVSIAPTLLFMLRVIFREAPNLKPQYYILNIDRGFHTPDGRKICILPHLGR